MNPALPENRRFFAPQAWVEGRWAQHVLLEAQDGLWSHISPDCSNTERVGAQSLDGPVLPGLVNAHSHAFQRAIAGLTERASLGRNDDFWSWREHMYATARQLGPQTLETIAAELYAELRQAGYTQVCEFHYLHNDLDGRPYADPLEMSLALVRAAQRAGIGLTLLPTLYMRAGFMQPALAEGQRRFASTPESVLRIAEAVRALAAGSPTLHAGIALHSLRAVDEGALRETAQAARAAGLPVHIHLAEQQREVQDCLQRHGRRPLEWLLENAAPDGGWNIVHATQANADELLALRRSGAAIVLCPSTEANLGDGLFDLPTWLRARGTWSIGSDSHISRSWTEELRLLEYGQRLQRRQRNVAATAAGQESTAAVLFEGALSGGTAAAGVPLAGLRVGQRADLMVLDHASPGLAGVPSSHVLDAAVFSSPGAAVSRVVVAARDAPQ
ncbi:MAG TPA: formimidoylglutamate deiminase [Ramlibacter sp.]|nr:formimidoylglutamate deiminase [Ramlibacter sp.]